MFARLAGHDHLLGDGHHPAPQRRRDDQGDRQRRAAAGQHRQARRRAVPGARPLQRAGRPHDGHLGARARPLPRRAPRRVRLRAAARARPRHRRARSRRCATARPGCSSAMGGNFVAAAPDTEVTEEAMRSADADRPRLHQAQPLARRARRRGADPARRSGRSEKDLTGGREQRVTVEDSMSAVHASHGPLEPAVGAPALRGRHRLLARPGHARRATRRCRGRRSATTTPRSAAGSPASSPAARRTTRRSTSPAASCCRTRRATTAIFPTPSGRAIFTVTPDRRARRARGPAAAADAALARPVQHHDLRPRRPLPRRQGRPPGGLRPPRRHRATSASPRATWSTWSASGRTASSGRRPAFRVVAYDQPRGCAAAYYPETNPLVPLDSTAEGSNTPVYKSIVVRLEPARAAGPGRRATRHGSRRPGRPARTATDEPAPPELSGDR